MDLAALGEKWCRDAVGGHQAHARDHVAGQAVFDPVILERSGLAVQAGQTAAESSNPDASSICMTILKLSSQAKYRACELSSRDPCEQLRE